ncbi:DUF3027 domain-containing protein [Nocardia farcinica]|uniref:DUF3027 domain-containing protein n=1 Tax=Nocardia farcinica (strain IFM 10152) TaxID=247156 RepID=Q5Z253_NOCFA|nr:DUF3027 domain-containing protein [Nocardia farcinica]BAD55488.1 hypothetical protein NFA_6430 [Nocardia farcinica IFM 10152]
MSAVSVSEPDVRPVLADAVDLARRALVELEPDAVGAYLGVTAEDETAATHRFEATLPGYRGWQWAVVVAAPPGAAHATVSESALLPGPEALVAPEFVPWEQRIRPGDLAPGDLLAPPADDPRLVPGYVANGDPEIDELAREVGLGRTKVMSLEGRLEAAERWYAEHGPDTEMAKAAPATCGTCGFYLPLAGSLRAAFGVCGNAMGADGHVVHVEYGCGAHSDVELPTGDGSPRYEAYDDAAVDVIPVEELRGDAGESGGAQAPEGRAGVNAVVSSEPADAASTTAAPAPVESGDAAASGDTTAAGTSARVGEVAATADSESEASAPEGDSGDVAADAAPGEEAAAPADPVDEDSAPRIARGGEAPGAVRPEASSSAQS